MFASPLAMLKDAMEEAGVTAQNCPPPTPEFLGANPVSPDS